MKIKRKKIEVQQAPRPAVGYKKPPVWTRFQKGQSGNPNGRPKKDESFRGITENELQREVSIKEGGRVKKVTIKVAIVKRCLAEAAQGKTRSLEMILKLLNRNEREVMAEDLTHDEQELWNSYFKTQENPHECKSATQTY